MSTPGLPVSRVEAFVDAPAATLTRPDEGRVVWSNPTTTCVTWDDGDVQEIPSSEVGLLLNNPEAMRLAKKWLASVTVENPGNEEPTWERRGMVWQLEGAKWCRWWGHAQRGDSIPDTEDPALALRYVYLTMLKYLA